MRKTIFLIVALAIAGGIFYLNRDNAQPIQEEPPAIERMDGSEMEGAGDKSAADIKVSGPLLDFNNEAYDLTIKSDKLIVLYFYANWCPICRAEFPKMQGVFNELTTDKVVGFRVNYNDSDTDDRERELAREFGVAYQHTKVFLKNGERLLKSPETWDKERYLSEINKALK